MSFGAQPLNKTSPRQTLLVRNVGGSTLNISSVSMDGRDSGQFGVAHGCSAVRAAASCTVFLTFRPIAVGSKSGTLTVAHDADGSPARVLVSGVGSTLSLSVEGAVPTPSALSELDVLKYVASYPDLVESIGTDIAKARAHYANFGFNEGRGITFEPLNYSASHGDLIESVAVDEINAVLHFLRQGYFERREVMFDPATYVSLNPDLRSIAETDSKSSVNDAETALARHYLTQGYFQGRPTAPEPVFLISRRSLDFGSRTINSNAVLQTITVRNSGVAKLAISGILVEGGDAEAFSTSSDCLSLTTGSSCTINVRFQPTREGNQTANLRISHNGFGSPNRVELSGSGVGEPIVEVSRTSVAFLEQRIGMAAVEQSITVRNTGATALSIARVSLAGNDRGDFSVSSDCGGTVLRGSSCVLRVGFLPTSPGAKTAMLTIEHNASGGSTVILLDGRGVAPFIRVGPTSIEFGVQPIGITSAPRSITVSNTGSGALNIRRVSVSGAGGPQFSQVNDCGSSIAVGSSCSINVRFTPVSSGVRVATLSIEHDASGETSTIALSGEGDGVPTLAASVSNLTYGNQLINTTSSAQTVTITNTGTANLAVSGVSVTGTDSAQFAQSNTCSAALAPSATCTISVTFTPASTGAKSASLSITHNGAGSPTSVALSGTGTAPGISVSPSTLSFGNQLINTASSAQTVTITNSGTAELTIAGVSVTGDHAAQFAQSNTCSAALAPNATCTINMTFTPASTGAKSASLSITHNGTGSPSSIALSGTGVAPSIVVSPSSVTFADQLVNTTSAARSITITNTGTANLLVTGVSVSDTAQFAQTNTCSAALAPNATCTISLTFSPTGTGDRAASLTITHNAAGSPTSVAINGTGTAPGISIAPSRVTFANQTVNTSSGSQAVTITNTGTANLTVSSVSVTGSDSTQFAQTNNCSTALAPNVSCTISVTFSPSATGGKTASLAISHSGIGSPTTVTLSGAGAAGSISVSPQSLSYSEQLINTTSAAQTVTISNPGTETLELTNGPSSAISVTGTDSTHFSRTTTCGNTLLPSQSCTVSVTFTPTSIGSKGAALSVAHSGIGSPTTVSLVGSVANPIIGVSPTSRSFNPQPINTTSAVQSVTLSNTGTTNLVFAGGATAAITLTGTDSGQFSQTTTCAASIAPGANCVVNVTFTPTSTGAKTATLSVAHNGANSPTGVSLSGSGTNAILGLSSSSLSFGNQLINTSSAAQVLTISNTGTTGLSLSSIVIANSTHSSQFSRTTSCAATLPPGESCTVSVTFTPTSTGAKTAVNLSITHNGPGTNPRLVALNDGVGIAPAIGFSPSSLSFGNQTINTTSAAQSVTITNTGTANLTVSGVAVSGSDSTQFAQTNTCAAALAPNATCTVSVTFTPTSSGGKNASLSVTHDAPGSPSVIGLSGSSTTDAITVTPTNLAFGDQRINVSSAVQTVTISNTGSGELVFTGGGSSAITLTGSSASEFSRTTTCGASLAVNASCTASVTFTPTTIGVKMASLSIAYNGAENITSVGISGVGINPIVSVTPSSLSFGSRALNATSGAQSVTVRNTGTTNLVFTGGGATAITITGANADQFGRTTTCGALLAPSATCTVSATFTPTSTGAKTASVSIAHTAAGSPSEVALTGTGISPMIGVSPSSVAFGYQLINVASGAQTITVSNTGTDDLVFSSTGGLAAITLTGTNANQYARSTTCGTSLTPNATCTVSVTFTPTTTGAKSATLAIAHNALGSPTNVPLTGTGVTPAISLSSTTISFDNQLINTTSATRSVTITNTGTANLTVSGVSLTGTDNGQFAANNSCAAAIAPNASCTVSVTFTPTSTGGKIATLSIAHDARPVVPTPWR